MMTETDILDEVIQSGEPSLSAEVARSILELQFSDDAVQRMQNLLDRNNQGVLTPEEEAELECFRRVGLFIDMLQSKARLSLKNSG